MVVSGSFTFPRPKIRRTTLRNELFLWPGPSLRRALYCPGIAVRCPAMFSERTLTSDFFLTKRGRSALGRPEGSNCIPLYPSSLFGRSMEVDQSGLHTSNEMDGPGRCAGCLYLLRVCRRPPVTRYPGLPGIVEKLFEHDASEFGKSDCALDRRMLLLNDWNNAGVFGKDCSVARLRAPIDIGNNERIRQRTCASYKSDERMNSLSLATLKPNSCRRHHRGLSRPEDRTANEEICCADWLRQAEESFSARARQLLGAYHLDSPGLWMLSGLGASSCREGGPCMAR